MLVSLNPLTPISGSEFINQRVTIHTNNDDLVHIATLRLLKKPTGGADSGKDCAKCHKSIIFGQQAN